MMTSNQNEVTQRQVVDLDGFSAGYSEPIRSDDNDGGGGGGSGFPGATKIKFDIHTAKWIDGNGKEVHKAVALDVVNRVQKWGPDGGPPLETITLAPGDKWPDIAVLNESCKDEWFEKFGKMTGPWQGEHVVLLVDPDTMVRYWWPSPTATIGACICVRTLMEQTLLMRKFQGAPVHALVELTRTFMNTAYGGRERPHMVVLGYGVFGEGGFKLLPKPTAKQITGDSIQF
jgi:hypothetical protein